MVGWGGELGGAGVEITEPGEMDSGFIRAKK